VGLAGYELGQGEETLALTLWWRALQAPQRDYTVFVHLFAADETIVAQSDAQPREGAYPTSWWAGGEVVSDTVVLPIGGVPEGSYRLAVGLYDPQAVRLPAFDGGRRLPDDRAVLPPTVAIGR
jgi:hypothetical protein